jgi:hypothetical protein
MTKMAARIDDLERQVDSLGRALETTRTNLLSLASRSTGDESSDESEKPVKGKKKNDKKAAKKAAKNERRFNESAADPGVVVDIAGTPASTTDGSGIDSNPAIAGI